MNIVVIGLGSMGKRRIKLLKTENPNSNIVGVDNNLERMKTVAEEYGINAYPNLEDVEIQLDCAFVCTSPQHHAMIISKCLERDMHVFSEINLMNDLYDENIRMAEEKGKTLFLSSTPLYKAEMQIIDRRVKQSREICVYNYHVGQYLPDWHPWDKLKDFFISNKNTNGCRELLAIELPWLQNIFGEIEKANVIKRKVSGLDIEFSDTYLIQLEHIGGNVGNLMIDVVSRQAVRHLEVLNENLYIKWDGTPDSLYEKDLILGDLKQIQAGEYIHEQGYGDFINEYAYAREIEEFFNVIKGKQPIYSFEQDKKILRIIDEIEK
ncbi:MAG: Gfo/Idh/MocA family oxidoreductase [Lachnospiraceae bacterium]|nr:Gfo/Idh/MocA family oxidoreductase [Lachnospiraceae bacterium]